MNLRELEAQAAALAPVIKMAVSQAVGPLHAELKQLRLANEDLTRRLDALPEPVAPDLEEIAKRVQLPEVRHGKDAEPVDLDALAKAAAALVVLPEVQNGKDAAEVDLEALAKNVLAMVEIPAPIPGKDAEPVDLKAVAALVEIPAVDLDAVAALVKVPEPIAPDVDAIARAAAALIPAPEVKQPRDGRDAIDLEILPAIDEAKQYPRGTYAAHRGGLWKSYERTHGLRGWECIVDGIDAVSVTQDAVREFSVTLAKSSGASVVQKFALPIQVYKGVYRDDEAYEAHDTVTWGGSQWASTKAENSEKPGSSDAWQLVVKAGRAGKDLRENASTFDAAKGVKLK